MGEAKRRAIARFEALPYRPPRVCPKCKSIRIARAQLGDAVAQQFDRLTEYDICRECSAVWEAYPDNWCEDVVGAEPCDNCAFRAGSPEQLDGEGWKKLIAQLRAGQEFKCHKGAPILGVLDERKPGEAAQVEFDAGWVRRHGRTCAGFMRMVWAMRAKGEDWAKRHAEFCGAPGYDMPLE
jgi:hypothetical protein